MSLNADEVSVDMTECEVVRGIIQRYLLNHGSISKFYVIEQIKRHIDPIRLFNIAIDSGPVTNDGAKNVHLGAQQVYRKAMKSLKARYICRRDAWIVAVPGAADKHVSIVEAPRRTSKRRTRVEQDEEDKKTLLRMAENGEPRPAPYTRLGRALARFTTE